MVSEKLDKESFAVALHCHRERLGMTQAEVAERLEISPRKWWQWEKAERETSYPEQVGALQILARTRPKS